MSTSPSSPKNSSTIIRAKVKVEKIGMPVGETGCFDPSEITKPEHQVTPLEVTREGHVTLSASTQRWLDETATAFREMIMSQDYAMSQPLDWLLEAKLSIEADIRGMIRLQRPPSDEQILLTLNAMAEMFQVEVPEAIGLELYMAALRTLPHPAFVRARDVLVLQHKWPRLPYPADFIEHGDEMKERLRAKERKLRYQRNAIIRALKILRNRTF